MAEGYEHLIQDPYKLGDEATTIATGGWAHAIVPHCEQIDELDDLLTLKGLLLIWNRNGG